MKRVTAHIINHTHWDREWFLTSVYTNQWIESLIDRLSELVEGNPNFHFFLDGQTLVIEDLLRIAPQYQAEVERLVRNGNLLIGPYYCQPDWRLTGGEALVRNLLYGFQDTQQHGGSVGSGWLVDTFGHISQSPQLHQLFGIDTVYIWRGTPRLAPFFHWRGPDGSQLFAINLFGGYRNLYGVTRVPEIAVRRLQTEIDKLQPYYPTPDIPLFDGYDLEDNPEDPVRFYRDLGIDLPPGLEIEEATPAGFAAAIQPKLQDIPEISGELLSGKYGSVFPGTLSTRDYLKVMAYDCEHLLYQVCEPLGAMARQFGRPYEQEQYEAWSRALLRNAVHDCICGVSIDQVHEKMEFSYWQAFDGMLADIRASLAYLLQDFAAGTYAVSTHPFPYEGWHAVQDELYHLQTQGVGVWEIEERFPIQHTEQPIDTFEWKNRHYEARVQADGTVQIGKAILGALSVYMERGDTYSDEAGSFLGLLQPIGPLVIEQKSDFHSVVRIPCAATWENGRVSAILRLTFDPSPLIRWQVDLDSRGTDFRVEIAFETGLPGQVYAGMPFDVVPRPTSDMDHLPRQLDGRMEAILLGQRELGATKTFPFRDFVAVSDGSHTAAVLTRGLHAYQADEEGRITIPLRRAVEWLTKPDLENRVGDAGPFFYVPDARCERVVRHELAAFFVDAGVQDPRFQALNAGFQDPPLIVESSSGGSRNSWAFYREPLPLTSLQISNGRTLARIFNPGARPHRLSKGYVQADVFGNPQGRVQTVPAKKLLSLAIAETPTALRDEPSSPVELINPPAWRAGPNQGLPDPAIIGQLEERIVQLERRIQEASRQIPQASARKRFLLQHRVYVYQREVLEYRLSARLNEIKRAMQGRLTYEYLYQPDEETAAIGRQLNQLRIQRRIYDYVVQAV